MEANEIRPLLVEKMGPFDSCWAPPTTRPPCTHKAGLHLRAVSCAVSLDSITSSFSLVQPPEEWSALGEAQAFYAVWVIDSLTDRLTDCLAD